MPFHEVNSIKYFTFDSLDNSALTHAVFTRQGGVSPAPWDSLKVGGYIGDPLENTYLNRVRSFEALGRNPETVYDVWQVHSADVICTDTPRPQGVTHKKADAILTNNPAITLFMRFADCVPILLFDPAGRKIAAPIDRKLDAGAYRFTWDARSIASGCYVLRLKAGSVVWQKTVQVSR